MTKRKNTMIYKTIHKQLQTEQHEPYKKMKGKIKVMK